MNDSTTLLEVDGLSLDIEVNGQHERVLDDLSLSVRHGEAMGLVGESGSGKSMTLKSIIGLLPQNAKIRSGEIRFEGRNIIGTERRGGALSTLRGTGISMVFQEPATALNPVMRVGAQIVDALARRQSLSKKAARTRAIDLMEQVGISNPEQRVDAYPFELSGGMRQRVMIAAAVAQEPQLLLCDEPTTALDVTIQAQILRLFASLQRDRKLGMLYVTHDLGVVAQVCSRLAVMRSGRILEHGELGAVFDHPRDDYTKQLLRASPRIVRAEPIDSDGARS